jgi:hypothetical protein
VCVAANMQGRNTISSASAGVYRIFWRSDRLMIDKASSEENPLQECDWRSFENSQ